MADGIDAWPAVGNGSQQQGGGQGVEFSEWHKIGMDNGWCGPTVCTTHDGLPTTAEEDRDWEEGGEPCIHVIRPYRDAEEKKAIEANHSPSTWRRGSP